MLNVLTGLVLGIVCFFAGSHFGTRAAGTTVRGLKAAIYLGALLAGAGIGGVIGLIELSITRDLPLALNAVPIGAFLTLVTCFLVHRAGLK